MLQKMKALGLSVLSVGAYNSTFVSADLDDIIVDFIGTYIAQFVVFAGLIALAVLAVWFGRRFRGGFGR